MILALLKHDAKIAKAGMRDLSRRAGDLLLVVIGFPFIALIAHASFDGVAEAQRKILAYGVSAFMAMFLSKSLLERVWFHQTEGALARFAQRPDEWLGLVLPLLMAGILVGISGMAAIGILHFESAILGTCSGVIAGLTIPFLRQRVRRWWRALFPKRGFDLLRHRHASKIGVSVSSVAGVICAMLPQEDYIDAIVSGVLGLAVVLLTGRVDASVVGYMALMGHSSVSSIRSWLPIQLALLVPMATVLLISQRWAAGGVTIAIAIGVSTYTALRVFAYRAFSRLIADWMVAALLLATVTVASAMPPLGPVIIIGALTWLARRGSRSRWLLT